MVKGFHFLTYSKNAEADRAFFRDVLGLKHVDSGGGWLIFKLPPSELGVHPSDDEEYVEMYLMCDDIESTIADLTQKGVKCSPTADRDWGVVTMLTLPSGTKLGMYQPKHPVAADLA